MTAELRLAAQRCIWFEAPEQAIKNIPHLVAYILTYGTPEDTFALRDQLNDEHLMACLDSAPPGIYDKRSWAYWNLVVGRFTAPPLPERMFTNC